MLKKWYESIPNLTFEERAYIALQLDKQCIHGHARQDAYVWRNPTYGGLQINCQQCHRKAVRKWMANEWNMAQ